MGEERQRRNGKTGFAPSRKDSPRKGVTEFRWARKDDLPGVMEVFFKRSIWMRENGHADFRFKGCRKRYRDEIDNGSLCVMAIGGKVVGCAVCSGEDVFGAWRGRNPGASYMYIYDAMSLPGQNGNFGDLLDWAILDTGKTLRLDVEKEGSENLINYYRKEGLEVVGETVTSDGVKRVLFEKSIGAAIKRLRRRGLMPSGEEAAGFVECGNHRPQGTRTRKGGIKRLTAEEALSFVEERVVALGVERNGKESKHLPTYDITELGDARMLWIDTLLAGIEGATVSLAAIPFGDGISVAGNIHLGAMETDEEEADRLGTSLLYPNSGRFKYRQTESYRDCGNFAEWAASSMKLPLDMASVEKVRRLMELFVSHLADFVNKLSKDISEAGNLSNVKRLHSDYHKWLSELWSRTTPSPKTPTPPKDSDGKETVSGKLVAALRQEVTMMGARVIPSKCVVGGAWRQFAENGDLEMVFFFTDTLDNEDKSYVKLRVEPTAAETVALTVEGFINKDSRLLNLSYYPNKRSWLPTSGSHGNRDIAVSEASAEGIRRVLEKMVNGFSGSLNESMRADRMRIVRRSGCWVKNKQTFETKAWRPLVAFLNETANAFLGDITDTEDDLRSSSSPAALAQSYAAEIADFIDRKIARKLSVSSTNPETWTYSWKDSGRHATQTIELFRWIGTATKVQFTIELKPGKGMLLSEHLRFGTPRFHNERTTVLGNDHIWEERGPIDPEPLPFRRDALEGLEELLLRVSVNFQKFLDDFLNDRIRQLNAVSQTWLDSPMGFVTDTADAWLRWLISQTDGTAVSESFGRGARRKGADDAVADNPMEAPIRERIKEAIKAEPAKRTRQMTNTVGPKVFLDASQVSTNPVVTVIHDTFKVPYSELSACGIEPLTIRRVEPYEDSAFLYYSSDGKDMIFVEELEVPGLKLRSHEAAYKSNTLWVTSIDSLTGVALAKAYDFFVKG